jgi:hypothetical protein
VREGLAFQIMQFLSAPLIAVTAYYLVAPDSRAATAALAFSSGFASEPILLAIRSAVDKLSPAGGATASEAATGTAKGSVRKAGVPLPNASIRVVGHPALKTQTDVGGGFSIVAPIGERVLEASDGSGSTKLTRVNLEAGKTVDCQLEL